MDVIANIRETVVKHNMLSDNDHVLIGLSGGPDSVCLAAVLSSIKEEYKLNLSALYVDHGLRPDETGAERAFCKEVCQKLDISFFSKAVDLKSEGGDGSNIQETARHLRYRAFEETAAETGATCIALGHNADDQAETVIMRLMRGSGSKGLSGIPPVRGDIIRPLITTCRETIESYLKKIEKDLPQSSGRPYIVDSSNLEDKYFRNWLRTHIMGTMKEKNPSVIEDISRTADILRDEDAYLDIMVTKTLMRMISRKSERMIQLFLTPLQSVEIPLMRRVLRRAVDSVSGLRGIGFTHIEDIIHLIKSGNSGDSLDLPKDIRVVRDYSLLHITTEAPVEISEYKLDPPGEVLIREMDMAIQATIEEEVGEENGGKDSVILDAGLMQFPLVVRARKEGDLFYPFGFGKKKKLQDFFVDEKVPRERRKSVPLVVSGNDIVWIAGHRADDRYKVTEKTERFLKLVYKKIYNR